MRKSYTNGYASAIYICLPKEDYEYILKKAKENVRSISSQIRFIIENHMKEDERKEMYKTIKWITPKLLKGDKNGLQG